MRTMVRLLFFAMLLSADTAFATSYPVREEEAAVCPDVPMNVGMAVLLFSSRHADLASGIMKSDILPVYRDRAAAEVGKVKFRGIIRENYGEAEVVEGEIRAGDAARKGSVLYLILPQGGK